MKIKNIFILSLIFFCTTVYAQKFLEYKNDAHQNMHDLWPDETPSQLSTRSIREYFRMHSLPTLALRGRMDEQEVKTSQFNSSFTQYIKDVFNKRGFAQMISQDATHIIEFLELSNELNLDTTTVYVCFRLFYNKIKQCELIDDSVILQLLQTLPDILEHHFQPDAQPQQDLNFLKKHIEDMMLARFTDHLELFQSEPDRFLNKLSEDVVDSFKQEFDKMEEEARKIKEQQEIRERLRQTIIKFFELALSKTIWNIKVHESVWGSFLAIANNLQLLGTRHIIDHMDDLDDLLWSLTYRFCFFLDLTGSTLPLEFYEELEDDLGNDLVYFLNAQEQDEGIKTKKEILIEGLIQGKTKAIAFNKGLIAHQL